MLANNYRSDWYTSHPPNCSYIHFHLAISTSAPVQCILVNSFTLPNFLPPHDLTWSRALNTGNVISYSSYFCISQFCIFHTLKFCFKTLTMHLICIISSAKVYIIRGPIKKNKNKNTQLLG